MLKKMKRRMILLAMLAFFIVMTLIVALINIFNYVQITRSSDDLLDDVLATEISGSFFPAFGEEFAMPEFTDFPDFPDQDLVFEIRFFVLRYDQDGNLRYDPSDYNAGVDEAEAASYGERILRSSAERGYIGNYRYKKDQSGEDTVIFFLNVTNNQEYMRSLLLVSLLIYVGSLILVFLLILLLSDKMIRPFVRNMEQQKQFITDAGHELKTPLTSISTSLDVIAMEHGEDEWTSNIRTQTNRMIQMVGDLVTLSRLDEASPAAEKETFCLSDAVWETVEGFQPMAKAQEKTFIADITENIMMTGNRISIQKMLAALLDNAIRYSGENGTVRVSLEKKTHIELVVLNTCHFDTIPDTTRLFERFYRPDESRSKDTGGTGIGMAIAQAAAEANGGTISAECPDGNSMIVRVVF